MYVSQHFEWLKKECSTLKNFYIFHGVGLSYAFITHFLNMINCINIPYKGDDFSFVSINLAEHQIVNRIHVG